MPPDPSDYDDRTSWMEACVPALIGEGREPDQAVAACSQMWRDRNHQEASVAKPKILRLPKLRAEVAVAPGTLNESDRTVEVRFYSGARVERFPMFSDPYSLAFSLDPKSVRLERFNAGAPLVDNHRDDLRVSESVLGVVERAWLEADGGHALVRFSAREAVAPIFEDVKSGVLRNFSMGAVIHKMQDVTEKGAEQKAYLAVDWEPCELSIVPVPADPGAQSLSKQSELFRCSLISQEGPKMSDPITETPDAPAPDSQDLELARQALADKRRVDELIEAKRNRAAELKRLGEEFGMDSVFIKRHEKLGTSIEAFAKLCVDEAAKTAPLISSGLTIGDEFESAGYRRLRMEDALAARALREEVPEPARQYARHTLAECAFEMLALAGKTKGTLLDARRNPAEVIKVALALHTTSDFPLLLANVLDKMLLPAYQQANPSYRAIAAQKTFNDFRAHQFTRIGDFPVPLQVNEHGEYQHGSMGETQEAVTCVTYGRIFGISRQALINDDLSALNDIAGMAGRRAADFENATFYTICINAAAGMGPTLSASNGGVAVFNAAHNNLTAGGALSNALLGSAYALMMAQTSIDGMRLNVVPRIVLTSPTSAVLAKTLLSAITPNISTSVNPFAGEMTSIADANLGTGTRFYVFADPAVLPNYVYGTISGQAGPRTEVRPGFEVDGVEVKLSLDFAAGAIDFRGAVSGAGA